MSKKITRSTVNENQYSAPEFPKSGFSLSYRRYSSFMLGRIHVGGFHWTMPGDKISGRTSSDNITFKRIVTPLVSPVNAMQYNIYLPLRALDRSFEKGIVPTKNNAMSANWTMPLCNTRYLVDQLMRAYYGYAYNAVISASSLLNAYFNFLTSDLDRTLDQMFLADIDGQTIDGHTFPNLNYWLYGTYGMIQGAIYSLTNDNGYLAKMANNLYMRDCLLDVAASITAKLGSIDNPLSGSITCREFYYMWTTALLEPFVGRYSYYAELKFEFVRPFDLYRIANGFTGQVVSTYQEFVDQFSNTPQNEYKLRMMYAIWYELFRNVDLMPVSTTLPDFRDWSSTSIFDMSAGGNLCYLLYRIRPWEKDMFISAQIDDISRHVYAPVYAEAFNNIAGHIQDINNHDTNTSTDPSNAFGAGSKPSIYNLTWRDQLSENDVSIACPVPANINDVLSSLDNSFVDVYGLDLNTLRQSQMLEKYLKRNYLFGDEYKDRMLAHYNSRVSDMRINKPEILSQSLDGYDMNQEVSNVSTSAGSSVGDRTATATININGNEFSTFCEEFGLVFSLVCFMPRAMYDGSDPLSYISKQVHLPLPEFAANNEEFGRKSEIAGSGLAPINPDTSDDNRYMFGRYPAYHAWRSRVDEVGGEFLDELQDCTFRRFFGMFSDDTTPKLNYFFINCRPNLQMFADPVLYDTQLYGDLVHDCFVERVLPTPVEVI